MNLDKAFKDQVKMAQCLKDEGSIQDYRSNATAGILWIKEEGEWIEVWNVSDILDFVHPYNGT